MFSDSVTGKSTNGPSRPINYLCRVHRKLQNVLVIDKPKPYNHIIGLYQNSSKSSAFINNKQTNNLLGREREFSNNMSTVLSSITNCALLPLLVLLSPWSYAAFVAEASSAVNASSATTSNNNTSSPYKIVSPFFSFSLELLISSTRLSPLEFHHMP